jgi:hypothetical protein
MANPRTGRPTVKQFLDKVTRYIGVPYVWGGVSPAGFDCSGLVYFALKSIGVKNVPRTSEDQWKWVQKVPANQVQPGDLIFLNFPGEASPGHVVIYLGKNRVIQAPTTGQNVQIDSFQPKPAGSKEWGGTVVGYGRIPGLDYANAAAYSGGTTQSVTGSGQFKPTLASGCILPVLMMLSGFAYLAYYLS